LRHKTESAGGENVSSNATDDSNTTTTPSLDNEVEALPHDVVDSTTEEIAVSNGIVDFL
jgi:hypothetical protein